MKNELLTKLKNGATVYGTCITSVAPLWSRAVQSAGLDFVFLDTEHIPLERMEIASLCQLYAAKGITPIVRIPSADPIKACQMIDAGAGGILAPYIEEIHQVKDMVGALKYRPLKGQRLAEVLDNPASMDPASAQYLANYNQGNLCVINIESVRAMDHLDELIGVPGVDAVFIGPHDLSVSLDLPEMYDHPDFEKAVQNIIEKCRKYNVAVGIHFSESPDRQIKWMNEGANIIIHSSDMAIFSQQFQKDINQIKNVKGEQLSSGTNDIVV